MLAGSRSSSTHLPDSNVVLSSEDFRLSCNNLVSDHCGLSASLVKSGVIKDFGILR
jgi:hypothetical protein